MLFGTSNSLEKQNRDFEIEKSNLRSLFLYNLSTQNLRKIRKR